MAPIHSYIFGRNKEEVKAGVGSFVYVHTYPIVFRRVVLAGQDRHHVQMVAGSFLPYVVSFDVDDQVLVEKHHHAQEECHPQLSEQCDQDKQLCTWGWCNDAGEIERRIHT